LNSRTGIVASNVVRVQASIEWRAFFDTASQQWIAVCDPLSLTASGKTWAILQDEIDEAINLLLLDIMKAGELDRFLSDRGWRLAGRPPSDPQARVHFDLPSHVIARAWDDDGSRL
jgi:predicted RNase H-like HicB family nuclease